MLIQSNTFFKIRSFYFPFGLFDKSFKDVLQKYREKVKKEESNQLTEVLTQSPLETTNWLEVPVGVSLTVNVGYSCHDLSEEDAGLLLW